MYTYMIYLDTCVLSDIALSDPESTELWHKLTRRKSDYEPVVSAYVKQESDRGDDKKHRAARDRLIRKMRVLPATIACARLGAAIRRELGWADDHHMDALHVAAASVHMVDFLVTWDKRLLRQRKDIQGFLKVTRRSVPDLCEPSAFLTRVNPPRRHAHVSLGLKESRRFRRRLAKDADGDEKKMLKLLFDPKYRPFG